MPTTTTLTRLERLDWLTNRLQDGAPMVLRDLADELGISRRTLTRDMQLLRERGLPLEADRGRGGGVRLAPNWGVGRISLTCEEAISLLIGTAATQKMDSTLLMTNPASVQRKLMASFSSEHRRRIGKLRHRIRVGPPSSSAVLAHFKPATRRITEKLQSAFLMMRVARIAYRSSSGASTTRDVEVHYLVLNSPVWYALCWDHLRLDVRTIRADRIRSIEVSDATFALRVFDDFSESMRGNEIITP